MIESNTFGNENARASGSTQGGSPSSPTAKKKWCLAGLGIASALVVALVACFGQAVGTDGPPQAILQGGNGDAAGTQLARKLDAGIYPINDIRVINDVLYESLAGVNNYSTNVTAPVVDSGTKKASAMRLDFSGTVIQDGDIIKVTSSVDGASQELTKAILEAYDFKTVYFNGMDVKVEYKRGESFVPGPIRKLQEDDRMLVVDRLITIYGRIEDDGIYVDVGIAAIKLEGDIDPTLCVDGDSKVRSFDPRVGRLMPVGCTAWLISQDVFLTAGHCVDNNAAAPGGYIVEFNVPLSDPLTGNPVNSAPADQYDARFGGAVFPVRGVNWEDTGIGNDWAVGTLLPNAITNLQAGVAQGCWFNLEYQALEADHTIRITGHGIRTLTLDLEGVQQTHDGPFVPNAADFAVSYVVDTTGGNSGSPIINEETGWSIGIHTNGGCANVNPETGANVGTSNFQPELITAVTRELGVHPVNQVQVRSPICGTDFPGNVPQEPTNPPSAKPSVQPSAMPSLEPSVQPSVMPSVQPSAMPSGTKSGKSTKSTKSTTTTAKSSKSQSTAKVGKSSKATVAYLELSASSYSLSMSFPGEEGDIAETFGRRQLPSLE